MGMVHSTSGRLDFTYMDLYKNNPLKNVPPTSFLPKSLLKRMLIRENELRLSDEYQKKFAEVEHDGNPKSWLDVVDELQRVVVTEFRLDEEMEDALFTMRCACRIFPEFKELPLYLRYNRAKEGDLKVGDVAPDTTVITMNGVECTLFSGCDGAKPTVLIGGSYSSPSLRSIMPSIAELYEQHKEQFNFVFVYIQEAHAQDEWPIWSARWSPTGKAITYNQAKSIEDRKGAATDFQSDFQFKMPMLLDDLSNSFEEAYASWPVRIYVVDASKTINYKQQPDPHMLELKALKQVLAKLIATPHEQV